MILRSRRVVLPESVRPASIHVEGGQIARVDTGDSPPRPSSEVLDVGDLVVAPGLVDTHVHVNEPGRTEWEGFDTATRAAAAGGVTTIVDMPLNSVPATTTVTALVIKQRAASGQCHVDVAFWGGVVPGNAAALDALVDAGVRGFKCFLVPSGVDEFAAVDEPVLREALPILARRRVPLLVHAEAPAFIRSADASATYATYLATRPPAAEREAVRLMVGLAREYGVHVHIVHVASADAAEEIAAARAGGVTITAETCPHYLTFDADAIPDGATEFKCAPPIRDRRHRDALWKALHTGTLDMIVTDHSPSPPSMKPRGDFMGAWGGIASLELSLLAVRTALQPFSPSALQPFSPSALQPFSPSALESPALQPFSPSALRDLTKWLSAAPARLAGFGQRKGRIAPGFDADLVVWDPDAETTVEPGSLQQRHKLTPYAGRRLRGRVTATFVRGACVWDGRALVQPGTGILL